MLRPLALPLAAFTAVAVGQLPPGFDVIQLTDDPPHDWHARINDHGQIVFESWRDGTEQGSDIFLWERDQMARLTNDNVRERYPEINDAGEIVWTRWIGQSGPFGPTGEIVLRSPDGVMTQITDDDLDDINATINASGWITWSKRMGDGCRGGVRDIYLYDGQSIRAITTDALSEGVANHTPRINDAGQIVWTRYDFCLNPWDSEIMLWDDGVTMQLTTTQFEAHLPDINNDGVVAWLHYPNGVQGIEIWEQGETRVLTDWGANPRLNDTGMVAFIRWHGSTQTWQDWLYRDGMFWQLSDDPFWNTDNDINDAGEVVWVSGGPGASRDIRYLRRFAVGDLNCDGSVDAFDIEPFILAILDGANYRSRFSWCDLQLADLNADGVVDAFDIEPFTKLLVP